MSRAFCRVLGEVLVVITLLAWLVAEAKAADCAPSSPGITRVVQALGNLGYHVGCGTVQFPANPTTTCQSSDANDPNPSTCYGTYQVPGRNGGALSGIYKLDSDEALVFIGTTPPSSYYFGFQTYVYARANPDAVPPTSDYVNIYASVGPAINQRTILGTVTRAAALDQEFSEGSVVVSTADPRTDSDIVGSALPHLFTTAANPGASAIAKAAAIANLEKLPNDIMELGSGSGPSDQLNTILRLTPFKDSSGDFNSAALTYMAAPPAVVLRVSPTKPRTDPGLYTTLTDPMPLTNLGGSAVWEQTLLTGAGIGVTEATAIGGIITQVIADRASKGLTLTQELTPGSGVTALSGVNGRNCIAAFEWNVANDPSQIDNSLHCAADSADADYVTMPGVTIPAGGQIVVVGVNHGTLGSGTYSNVAIQNPAPDTLAMTNLDLNGSAASFLPSSVPAAAANDFYVATLAEACAAGTVGCRTAPAGVSLGLIERNYLAPLTGARPDYTDIFLPYVLVFTP